MTKGPLKKTFDWGIVSHYHYKESAIGRHIGMALGQ